MALKNIFYLKITTLLIFVYLQGCAEMFEQHPPLFKQDTFVYPKITEQTVEKLRFELHEWPYEEYWTGITLNKSKVGYSYFHIEPDEKRPGTFLIKSELLLHFNFLTTDKKVKVVSRDWVNPDLTINGFVYDYNLDGSHMKLYGTVRNNILDVVIDSSAGRVTKSHQLFFPLYPASVINLYPPFKGLKIGETYRYMIYDGESQHVTTLTQNISEYKSSELFDGKAYKVTTSMHGQNIVTWIDSNAKPLIEISMDGAFIANLQSKNRAKHFLTQAIESNEDTLLNFSLIETDQILDEPRHIQFLELELSGAEAIEEFPVDLRQQCSAKNNVLICKIIARNFPIELEDKNKNYLASTIAVPTRHETIINISNLVTAEVKTDGQKVKALLKWIKIHITPELTDVFSALDVLEQRKAECQGFSFLYASFARAIGIPTRIVNGIVYSEIYKGFLYHTWVESQLDGQWQAIDPTFGQFYADATHIKLAEGENMSDLTPLFSVIGKLSAKIVKARSK